MRKRRNLATDEVYGGPIIRKYKQPIRTEEFKSEMTKSANRAIGRLEGVKRMIEENRYCGDILMQIAATQSMLRRFEYAILNEHLTSCVLPEVAKGNEIILDELEILIKTFR